MEVDLLRLLVVRQLRLLPQCAHLLQEELLDVSVAAQRREAVARDVPKARGVN